jgi:nucleoside 2-deoxyribosyltransferase
MRVFVASPIGTPKSAVRKQSDKLLRYVVEPACRDLGLEVIRADKLKQPGRITEQVEKHLNDAAVVIADVTGLNANVMFELGVRAGLQRPFVLLAKREQKLPCDLTDLRTISYALDLVGAEAARDELKGQLAAVLPASGTIRHEKGQSAVATPASRDLELAFVSVGNYLERVKRTKSITFDGVRKYVNSTYTDALLTALLHEYPNRFRQVRFKGGKLGVGLAS